MLAEEEKDVLDNQVISSPRSTGHPQSAVDNLGVPLVGCLHGGKHAEAITAGVDVLGPAGTQQSVEDVAGS